MRSHTLCNPRFMDVSPPGTTFLSTLRPLVISSLFIRQRKGTVKIFIHSQFIYEQGLHIEGYGFLTYFQLVS